MAQDGPDPIRNPLPPSRVSTWTRRERVVLSLQACAAGWAAVSLWWVGAAFFMKGPAVLYALGFTVFIAAYVGIGWLVVALPLSLLVDPNRWPLRWPWTPFFGAVCGSLILAALLRSRSSLILMGGLAGFVAGIVYGLRVRRRAQRTMRGA